MLEIIAFDKSSLVEFGMVDEQNGLAGLLHHDALDAAFAFVGLHDAFFEVNALAADEGEVNVVFAECLAGDGAGECAGTLAHRAARADHLKAAVREIAHEADGVRDDRDVALSFEALQQCLTRRTGVHHDGIAIVNQVRGLFGDGQLALAVDGAAPCVGQLITRALGDDGTAVAAAQKILTLKFFKVAPDGFFGHLEGFGPL